VQETKVNAIIAEKKKDFIMVFGVKSGKRTHKSICYHTYCQNKYFSWLVPAISAIDH